MKSHARWLAFIFCTLAGTAGAQGGCPPGYFRTNPTGGGYIGCAPIPEQPPPVQWTQRWGAIAGDGQGHWGESDSRHFRLQATREALRRCRENGGERCKLTVTYGDQCVAQASDGETAVAMVRPTRDAAVDAALSDCAGYARGRECRIRYSACSQL